ncbi:hypothetical protein MTO96_029652 [Rhipicephalus appendiculatus]
MPRLLVLEAADLGERRTVGPRPPFPTTVPLIHQMLSYSVSTVKYLYKVPDSWGEVDDILDGGRPDFSGLVLGGVESKVPSQP